MSGVFDIEPEFLELYEACREFTMTSMERMYALYGATRHVVESGVRGDLVECGVWRGGSVMLMAMTLMRAGRDERMLWLYDTFSGMTAPSREDVQAMSGRSAAEILAAQPKSHDDPFWGISPRLAVERNVRATGYPWERVKMVEGDVRETIPASAPGEIAILRLDTDWYASTRHELEHLYPRLVPGGVLIIDDYGYWTGARQATDEYLATLAQRPMLHRIDYTGRIAVKPGA